MTATIAQLRHFIALAESGSFTRAAHDTRRSQAAFSRSIAELEGKLGAALVERVGHRNTLTAIGRTVLAHARLVVAQADELQQVVQHHVSGDAGHVRLGLAPTPAALLTQPLLDFALAHPGGMKLRLSRGPLDRQLAALRERQLDAVVMDVRALPHASGDLRVEKLCKLAIGALCRPGHPLCAHDGLTFAELLRYPVAGTGMSATVARHAVELFGAAAHPDSFITLECEDVGALLQTASTSDAVYVGILAPAHQHLRDGALVQLPFAASGIESHLAWVQRATRAPNPVLDGMRENVRAWLDRVAPAMPDGGVSAPAPGTA